MPLNNDFADCGGVTVLMSVYRPDLKFFGEQLDSIDCQTYPVKLLVRNDCPESASLEPFICDHVKLQKFTYIHGITNLGYVKSFECLLDRAESDYVVFCDQDDVWMPKRVELAIQNMMAEHSILDVCDRSIIDENDSVLIQSYRDSHPHSPEVNWVTGDDITVQAASVCYGIGMALMVRTDIAKTLIPFPESTAHDLWLTLCCSELGRCSFTKVPLVCYRRHGFNVSGLLAGIESKEDWYKSRVANRADTARQFSIRFPRSSHLGNIMGFADARFRRSVVGLLKYRNANPKIALFEVVLNFTPDWLFRFVLKLARRTN